MPVRSTSRPPLPEARRLPKKLKERSPLLVEPVARGGRRRLADHRLAPLRGHRERHVRGCDDRLLRVLRHEAVDAGRAELAVADRVGAHDERAEGHRLERRQVEALGGERQEHRRPRAREASQELAAGELRVEEIHGARRRAQTRGDAAREVRLLRAGDDDVDVALLDGRRVGHIHRVRDHEHRSVRRARRADRRRDLLADADPDRAVREQRPPRVAGVGVPHAGDQVEDGDLRLLPLRVGEELPVERAEEEHVGLHRVARGDDVLARVAPRVLLRPHRVLREDDPRGVVPRRERVAEEVADLEVAPGEAAEPSEEEHRSRRRLPRRPARRQKLMSCVAWRFRNQVIFVRSSGSPFFQSPGSTETSSQPLRPSSQIVSSRSLLGAASITTMSYLKRVAMPIDSWSVRGTSLRTGGVAPVLCSRASVQRNDARMLRVPAAPALLAVAAAAVAAGGCVERKMMIRSDPPGAVITLDGERLEQRTPAEVPFDFGGTRGVTLAAAGYRLLDTTAELRDPWFTYFPLDVFAEFLWPGTIEDVQEFDFALQPYGSATPEMKEAAQRKLAELKRRAESFRAGGAEGPKDEPPPPPPEDAPAK